MNQNGIFGWNDVGYGAFCFISIILLIMYIVIWQHERFLPSCIDNFWRSYCMPFLKTCLVDCNSNSCDKVWKYTKGDNYWAGMGAGKCVFNMWEISHIMTHMFIGYFGNFYISTVVSVGFEYYEYSQYNCESYFDIIYNFIGFLMGHTLKHGFDGL
jgi:hypothetical protein